MKWLAPAKVNLSLRVLGRRSDGYHELETLMVPLDLADEVIVEMRDPAHGSADPVELYCSDPTLPVGSDNLAWRAAELFRSSMAHRCSPIRVTLEKHVPHGAGLGGGSSDAAAVLLALNGLHGCPFDVQKLASLGAELGSDVPFFVFRSAAICRGRGENVEPIPFPHAIPLVLLKPPFPVPTPWAYRQWANSRELPEVPYDPQPFPWGELRNDLERPVFEKYLLLSEIKRWLLAQGEVAGALLSGSGSTMIAVLKKREDAQTIIGRAEGVFGPLWTCLCTTVPIGGSEGTCNELFPRD